MKRSVWSRSLSLMAIVSLTLGFTAKAQQQWIGAMPTYYIPAFAGSEKTLRVSSYSRYAQSAWVNNGTRTPYGHRFMQDVAVDTYIPKLSTGIGLNIGYSYNKYDPSRRNVNCLNCSNNIVSNEGFYSTLTIAPKIRLGEKLTLSPAISTTLRVNDVQGYDYFLESPSLTYSGSLLLSSKKFHIGSSVGLLPYSEFFFARYYVDLRIQTGYTFQRNDESNFSFTPTLLFSSTYGLGLNLNFRYKHLLAGIGIDQMMLGFQNEKITIMALYRPHIKPIKYYVPYQYQLFGLSLNYRFLKSAEQ